MKKVISIVILASITASAGVIRFAAKHSYHGVKHVASASKHASVKVAHASKRGAKRAAKVAY